MNKRQYKLLSLFSGAGGLDLGFEQAGHFETLVAVEMQREYHGTLATNQKNGYLTKASVITSDVRQLNPRELAQTYFPNGKVDGIIGGPPCESFSVLGAQQGIADPRGMLVYEFVKWVKLIQPQFCLMENVPPLEKLANGAVLTQLLDELGACGYVTTVGILNAANYGAPTSRKRLFILGSRTGKIELPEATHGKIDKGSRMLPFRTVQDAFAGLPIPSLSETKFPTWHRLVTHTEAVVTRFSALQPGQRDPIRKRTRIKLNAPSPAVFAGNLEGARTHIHPTEPRELTNRETARLQGFPDDYQFIGGRVAVCKQIANAVPVPLARAIAEAIANNLTSKA
jgi:DNA (cytosine-5)-methyltransferase 1